MFRFFACLFFFIGTGSHNSNTTWRQIKFSGTAQGTTYHITYYATDSLVCQEQVDSVLLCIDSSLSLYKPWSLVTKFNQSADGCIMDDHMARVVNKALDTYRRTNGLFDITVEPLTQAWGFGPVKTTSLPDSNSIHTLLSCVDSRLLYVEGNRLRKKKACVQLDPNGIAQGYSVDVLASFFETKGIRVYLIELGGELRIRGRKPDGKKMSVGIEAPGDNPDSSMIERVAWLDAGALTTSGNYRRFYENKGKKIAHLLDPHTGYPIQNELISVTVYAPDAITADAYDNALMGMGLKKALAFVEARKDLAAHFIYRKEDGSVADTLSKHFRSLLRP